MTFDPTDSHQGRFAGYLPTAMPSPLDADVRDFLESSIAAGAPALTIAAQTATAAGQSVLLAFAERMASLAVRRQTPGDLVIGLVAIAIGGLTGDEPEALMPLALIDWSARRLGIDGARVFGEAAAIVGEPASHYLNVWLSKPTDQRGIGEMGFSEGSDPGGFRYVFDR